MPPTSKLDRGDTGEQVGKRSVVLLECCENSDWLRSEIVFAGGSCARVAAPARSRFMAGVICGTLGASTVMDRSRSVPMMR